MRGLSTGVILIMHIIAVAAAGWVINGLEGAIICGGTFAGFTLIAVIAAVRAEKRRENSGQ